MNVSGEMELTWLAGSVVLRSDALAVSDQAIYSGTEAGEIMYLDRTTEDLHILIDLKNHFPRASPIGLALAKQVPIPANRR